MFPFQAKRVSEPTYVFFSKRWTADLYRALNANMITGWSIQKLSDIRPRLPKNIIIPQVYAIPDDDPKTARPCLDSAIRVFVSYYDVHDVFQYIVNLRNDPELQALRKTEQQHINHMRHWEERMLKDPAPNSLVRGLPEDARPELMPLQPETGQAEIPFRAQRLNNITYTFFPDKLYEAFYAVLEENCVTGWDMYRLSENIARLPDGFTLPPLDDTSKQHCTPEHTIVFESYYAVDDVARILEMIRTNPHFKTNQKPDNQQLAERWRKDPAPFGLSTNCPD